MPNVHAVHRIRVRRTLGHSIDVLERILSGKERAERHKPDHAREQRKVLQPCLHRSALHVYLLGLEALEEAIAGGTLE